MLERLELLLGKENLEKLHHSTVLVIGVGGVGGYAVEALARSGIGKLLLVDPDKVEESNMNRQIVALTTTLGRYKVEVLKERIEAMGLSTVVQVSLEFVTATTLPEYLENVDFVVDACDTLPTKFAIIKECLERKIPFISSMGMGNKLDPSKLSIMELKNTSYDPLARRLRKLVKDSRLSGKVMVVASTEEKKISEEKTIPSNVFVPGSAGFLCASYVVNQIISR